MGVRIETATPEDIPAIATLNAEVQALHHEWAPTRYLPAADVAAFFGDAMASAHQRVLIARVGAQPAGYALLSLETREATPFSPMRIVGHVEHVSVAQASRRRGVGRALVSAAMAALRDMGAEELDAFVRWENAASRALFAAAGFGPRLIRFGTVG